MGRPRAPLRGAWERLEESTRGCWPGPTFEATSFSLIQSQLNPAGAVYATVATFPKFP
jgi:2'-5' RNA ligase